MIRRLSRPPRPQIPERRGLPTRTTARPPSGGNGRTTSENITQSVTVPASPAATLSYWIRTDTAETGTTALAAHAGKTITVKFLMSEDSTLQTSFVVDDTAVIAS